MAYSFQARALPKPGAEKIVESAMQMFAQWVLTQPGILHIHQMKDLATGELVGISFWKSKVDCDRMWAAAALAPDAEQKNQALAAGLQRPIENRECEVLWEGTVN
jgi:heme-degrading monooxygenase HmoA